MASHRSVTAARPWKDSDFGKGDIGRTISLVESITLGGLIVLENSSLVGLFSYIVQVCF